MRSIGKLTSIGLLSVLTLATFVACKKEKEQNGPEIIVGSGTNVRLNDTMIIGNIRPIIIELSIKKGSGKDDGDLKSYTVVVKKDGSTTNDGYSGNAPNGSAFTLRDTFDFSPQVPTTYEITITVTDKNDKSASKTFKIIYRNPSQAPGAYYMGTITVDTVSVPFIYFENFSVGAKGLNDINDPKNVIAAFLVRRITANDTNRYSLVTPDSLGKGSYAALSYVYWTASSKPRTVFYSLTENEYNMATDSVSIHQVVISATSKTKFIENGDGARALIGGTQGASTTGPHNYLAFQQEYPAGNPSSKIWGVIKVNSVSGRTASLQVKLILR
ncbi:MAG: hypothetical protein NZZ60_08270 [Bacteroidia bacterium]|nr:hypothetical protein [Bacteroidia bacterium]